MAGNTDFLALFQELGLSAGCRLDEFKLAFRRRVAQLHPDRKTGSGRDDAESRLQRLIAMHDAAMEFHRRHGRLPGVQTQARQTPPPASAPPVRAAVAPASRRSLNSTFLVIASLIVLLLAWWLLETGSNEDGAEQPQATAQGELAPAAKIASAPHAYPRLALGMNRKEVLAVQGEPVSATRDHWEYGPSWIAFTCGKLSDWYNSPLRPLHAGSQHPLPTEAKPTYRAVDCAEGVTP